VSEKDAADPVTLAVSREIKAWMARRDMSQGALAKAIGMHAASMSSRMRGKTDWTVNEILSVAETLRVAPTVLLTPPSETETKQTKS
jgi:hypothetical protein